MQAIQTSLGNVFASTPLAILQPRTAIAWQVRAEDGVAHRLRHFQRHSAGKRCRSDWRESALRADISGRLCLGTVGLDHAPIAPGVPNSAVDATVAANQRFTSGFAQGQLSCASPLCECRDLPSAGRDHRRSRTANFTRRTSCSGASGSSISSAPPAACKAQYVGTRAVNQPYPRR